MSDFPVTIFHNPKCGTSRNTLAALPAGLVMLAVCLAPAFFMGRA